jgi:uncharacterized damage-inducible protein DinB
MADHPLLDMIEYNRWANFQLFALVDRASAEGLQASQQGMYGSILETLTHLVNVELNFLKRIRDEPRERLSDMSVDALRGVLDTLGPSYAAVLAGESDYVRPVFIPWLDDGVNIRLTDAMIQPITHSIQHRADIIGALSRAGIEPPAMDYVRWVLDGRPEFPNTEH